MINGNSTLRFAQQSVAGSGFAPQAQALSIIPALPFSYFIAYRYITYKKPQNF